MELRSYIKHSKFEKRNIILLWLNFDVQMWNDLLRDLDVHGQEVKEYE